MRSAQNTKYCVVKESKLFVKIVKRKVIIYGGIFHVPEKDPREQRITTMITGKEFIDKSGGPFG